MTLSIILFIPKVIGFLLLCLIFFICHKIFQTVEKESGTFAAIVATLVIGAILVGGLRWLFMIGIFL